MESGRRKHGGGIKGKREQKQGEKRGGDGSPRESGMEEKREGGGGEGGKVWKLADRTGYAQTGSQAQAQT